MSLKITKIPWVQNFYVGDGIETFFGNKRASAFASAPTPTEVRTVKTFKANKSEVKNITDYTNALTVGVEASGGIAAWGASFETKNSFFNERNINTNTVHFMVQNYYIKDETMFKREQLDALVFSPTALTMIKNKQWIQFKKNYGDSFVVGYVQGGYYFADVAISSYTAAETTDISAKASTSWTATAFTADGGVNFQNTISSLAETHSVQCYVSGTGVGMKTISIGDIAKMIEDAGKLEDMGNARIYAILMSYDDLPQWKNAVPVGTTVDIQPKITAAFAKKLNERYLKIKYYINQESALNSTLKQLITDSDVLAAAQTNLNTAISTLRNFDQKFENLTTSQCENMSAANAAGTKLWNDLKTSETTITSIVNFLVNNGVKQIGTNAERATFITKINLLETYNKTSKWASPSPVITQIIADLRATAMNPLMTYFCLILEQKNRCVNEIGEGGPDLWDTPSEWITYLINSFRSTFALCYFSEAERQAMKVHLDQLQVENDVNSASSPWNNPSTWLDNWIARSKVSSSLACYGENLAWFFSWHNQNKRQMWFDPDPVIAGYVKAIKFIYNL
ncbi:hypothetical protein SAMD00019534_077760 [Acytostelium subglobosum LB1]|uniref:hypothetical protein n=1 Tax=Acytostelium subglobosum LB1 TaxID=1410327 RepID=UPI0006451FFA|nr:hypothetical protein SAMD00019534_077760 [Acytostelium subglobosum LB1]GAM24601.1 hypothetical protein SAMD00019534_077760 [Acytostelium subglobosum LB1]|eukprot:XP_012752270.1 hypothetical protein SAMD00019534_077760 [Acytostelium subglobosum LB1]